MDSRLIILMDLDQVINALGILKIAGLNLLLHGSLTGADRGTNDSIQGQGVISDKQPMAIYESKQMEIEGEINEPGLIAAPVEAY